jgi:hypothetical protein
MRKILEHKKRKKKKKKKRKRKSLKKKMMRMMTPKRQRLKNLMLANFKNSFKKYFHQKVEKNEFNN